VGADVLEFVGSVLTVHPEKAIRAMKQKFVSVASQVRSGGNPAQIQKLKSELERLNKLGGIEKIVANEGLVFVYNGKTYKLTGTFAPLNQILGIFYS
jgi:organic radical activating enzyme